MNSQILNTYERQDNKSPITEEFNRLSLKSQRSMIMDLNLKENKKKYKEEIVNSLTNLLDIIDYMLSLKIKKEDEHYLSIILDSEEKISNLNEIYLTITSVDMINENNCLNSPEFFVKIKKFKMILTEVEYPSPKFHDIYEKVQKLKKQCTNQLQISVFITQINKNDIKFRNDKSIYMVKFGPSVNIIPGDVFLSYNQNSGGSFRGCTSLTEVVIPQSVTSIEEGAFYGCTSLNKITFSNLNSIGKYAFKDCKSLANITIPSSLTIIKESAFSGCSSLANIDFESLKSPLNNVSLLDSIEDYAFSRCTLLEKISIPSSVKYIGKKAFTGCTSLKEIAFVDPSSKKLDISSMDSYERKSFIKPGISTKISIKVSSFNETNIILIGKDAFVGCSSLEKILNYY